jgi:hypothetical protein
VESCLTTLAKDAAALEVGHVLDAVIAAYTGWLGSERLGGPPAGVNLSAGWIWVPRLPSVVA